MIFISEKGDEILLMRLISILIGLRSGTTSYQPPCLYVSTPPAYRQAGCPPKGGCKFLIYSYILLASRSTKPPFRGGGGLIPLM
jgi:hypothetical protein